VNGKLLLRHMVSLLTVPRPLKNPTSGWSENEGQQQVVLKPIWRRIRELQRIR
jgi:hypothetical protein